jgi:GT2 family glycosyltransferase
VSKVGASPDPLNRTHAADVRAGAGCRVDFIVLSWNRTEETIAAIESARAQEGVIGSVIVVDQGSEPTHLMRLRAHVAGAGNVRLKELGRNIGVPAGRNIATRMGDAPVVIALDSDAEFGDRGCAQRAVAALAADETLAAVAFRVLDYRTRRDDESSWGYPGALRASRHEPFFTSRFVGAGHAIRRAAFEAVGGYDDDFFFAGEEIDLGLRLINAGYRIKYDPAIQVLHKLSPEGRIGWRSGRFYYTVRNELYTLYKSGAPAWRIARRAAARLLTAARHGLMREWLRALRDAAAMCRRYRPDREQRRLARLRPDTAAYLRVVDRADDYGFRRRLRNALRHRLNRHNE